MQINFNYTDPYGDEWEIEGKFFIPKEKYVTGFVDPASDRNEFEVISIVSNKTGKEMPEELFDECDDRIDERAKEYLEGLEE